MSSTLNEVVVERNKEDSEDAKGGKDSSCVTLFRRLCFNALLYVNSFPTKWILKIGYLINNFPSARQRKSECDEAISHIKHKSRMLDRRVAKMARQV